MNNSGNRSLADQKYDGLEITGEIIDGGSSKQRKLLSYGNCTDILILTVAVFTALIHGASLPVNVVFARGVIDKFITHSRQVILNRSDPQATIQALDIESEVSTMAQYMMISAAVTVIAGYLENYCWTLYGLKTSNRLQQKYFEAVMRQDGEWQDKIDPGEIASTLTSSTSIINEGTGQKFGLIIEQGFRFISGVAFSFYFSWKLTVVVLAAIPLLVGVGSAKSKILASWSMKERQAYDRAGAAAEEILSAMKTVISFDAEENEINRYNAFLMEAKHSATMKGIAYGISIGLYWMFAVGTYALAFWYGSKLFLKNEVNGGDVVLVFFSIAIGADHLGHIGPYIEAFSSARAAKSKLMEVIERIPKVDIFSPAGYKGEFKGDIAFKDVTFCYPKREDVQVLSNFSTVIDNGRTIGIVGHSGCGKSTVIKLIQRIYKQNDGEITIGNLPIECYNIEWLRSNIGVVSQDSVLFDASIRENILSGKLNASETELMEASKLANAHSFIDALPKGYDTQVGQNGFQLSGGQRQRIALARALIKNPKILLLDEATSALDNHSEMLVKAALDKARIGRTTIIVAHRLSTVQDASEIIVLNDGHVKEKGSHHMLLESKGLYFNFDKIHRSTKMRRVSCSPDHRIWFNNLSTTGDASNKRKLMQSSSAPAGRSITDLLALERENIKRQILSTMVTAEDRDNKVVRNDDATDQMALSFQQLLKLNFNEWNLVTIGCICQGLTGLLPIAISLYISEMLQTFSSPNPENIKEKSNRLSSLMMGFAIIMGISFFISGLLLSWCGERLTSRMRLKLFSHFIYQDLEFFDVKKNDSYTLSAVLSSDCAKLKGASGVRLGFLTEITVTITSALILGFISSWQMTLLTLAFFPLLICAGIFNGNILLSSAEKTKAATVLSNKLASEAISNLYTVNGLNLEKHFISQYIKMTNELLRMAKITLIKQSCFAATSDPILILAIASCFRLGAYLVARGDLEFHQIFRVFIAVNYAAIFSGIAMSLTPDYVGAKLSAAKIFHLLKQQPKLSRRYPPNEILKLQGKIEMRDIHLSYPSRPEKKVLSNFNISIEPGKKYAFVGSSGSGKSSIVSLLQRLYRPTEGSILIDNNDVEHIHPKILRENMAAVSQDPQLFKRSIRQNILFGKNCQAGKTCNISDEEIFRVAKASNIHNFIMGLPKGYDTEVGVKGVLLSGGQKQRIAIARALIKHPKILILDEATSALDMKNEQILQRSLSKVLDGCTSIIIAHRLSTIKHADTIAVIRDGKISERGTHEQLLNKKGYYYSLYHCAD